MSMYKEYYFVDRVTAHILKDEINASPYITIKCTNVETIGEQVTVYMAAELPTEQLTVLANLVSEHDPGVLDEEPAPIVSVIENPNVGDVYLNFKVRPRLYFIPSGYCENIPGAPYSFTYVSPYPIMLLGAVMDIHSAMVGDSFELKLLDDTVIGAVVQKAYMGQTTVVLSPGASQYVYPGFRIGGFAGEWGEVVRVSGDTIHLGAPLIVDVDPGTYALVEYSVVERRKILSDKDFWATRDTQRGANIPAGQPMQLLYWNDSGTSKEIQLNLAFYL